MVHLDPVYSHRHHPPVFPRFRFRPRSSRSDPLRLQELADRKADAGTLAVRGRGAGLVRISARPVIETHRDHGGGAPPSATRRARSVPSLTPARAARDATVARSCAATRSVPTASCRLPGSAAAARDPFGDYRTDQFRDTGARRQADRGAHSGDHSFMASSLTGLDCPGAAGPLCGEWFQSTQRPARRDGRKRGTLVGRDSRRRGARGHADVALPIIEPAPPSGHDLRWVRRRDEGYACCCVGEKGSVVGEESDDVSEADQADFTWCRVDTDPGLTECITSLGTIKSSSSNMSSN